MEQILQFDYQWFFMINREWTSPILDVILVLFRNRFFWAPLYLFLIGYFIINHKKDSFIIIAMLLLSFILADNISSSVIKPFFERLRPCNDPFIKDQVRLLVECGSGFSFTSSHATNHFAIACFLISFFYKQHRWVVPVGLLWAGSVAYAQVYVGVHFPIDVITGAIIGSGIGLTVAWFLKNKILIHA